MGEDGGGASAVPESTPLLDLRKEEACQMRAVGRSERYIAHALSEPKTTVHRWLNTDEARTRVDQIVRAYVPDLEAQARLASDELVRQINDPDLSPSSRAWSAGKLLDCVQRAKMAAATSKVGEAITARIMPPEEVQRLETEAARALLTDGSDED